MGAGRAGASLLRPGHGRLVLYETMNKADDRNRRGGVLVRFCGIC